MVYLAEEVGVEPTEPALTGSTGFEVRAPHREMSLFQRGCYPSLAATGSETAENFVDGATHASCLAVALG